MTVESRNQGGGKGLALLAIAMGILIIPVIAGIIIRSGGNEGDGGGMGGDGNTVSIVRPLSEILDGEIVLDADASGTTAVVRLDTTIDMACAVTFGTGPAFGSIATDTNMAGGGHRNHSPLLTGLQPGTTYLYRVQGVGPDGTLYQSETMQFTSPGESGAAARTNLAIGATVLEVSSEYSADWSGANAIDGSLATEWSSAGDGDDAFIVIDLGSPQMVTGVGFRTREMSDGTSITNTFTFTVDGGQTYGPFDAGQGLAVADVAFTGQVIRIDVDTSTGGNTGAVEIEIYGS